MKSRSTYSVPKGDVKKVFGLLPYLKPYWRDLIGVFIALLLSSASVLSLGHGLERLVDDGFAKQDPILLNKVILILAIITCILALSTYTRFYLITKIGEQVIADIRRKVYQSLIHLSPYFFETTKVGELVSRFTADTSILQTIIGSSLSIALRNMLLLVGGITMMIVSSPTLTLYIIIAIPMIVLPILLFGKKVRSLSKESQDKVAEIGSHIDETLGSIKIVQAYCQEAAECEHFFSKTRHAFDTAMKRIKTRARLTAMVILLAFGSVTAILWIGGHDVLKGHISPGELASFVFYSLLVAGAFGAISEVFGDMQRAAGAAEGVLGLLHPNAHIALPSNPITLPDTIKGEIVFENVTFSYPSRPDIPSLHELSFSVAPGTTVALVGKSGAGKTTILQLLLRFYSPDSGSITIDGVDMQNLLPQDIRTHCAYVSQEPIIFSDNVWENIRYGKINASDEEVINAAKAARAYDFIQKLPQQFDSYLGEKGVRLSGGEKQRITIARAILRDPKILLLDEATNALDAENEQLVQEALDTLMKKCTTIVIAHRLSTILNADNIIVMDRGKIESQGTHETLVAEGSLYAKLAEIQLGP